jgi:CHAD domain-containing protein
MSGTDQLLSAFDRAWKDFSTAWKEARSHAAEEPIHDLRVNVRRLVATLELARRLSRNEEIATLARRFKKVLKSMGSLRDVQVQLQNVEDLRRAEIIQDFKQALEQREKREIERIAKTLKAARKQQLSKGVKAIRDEFERLHKARTDENVRESIEGVVRSRSNEFLRSRHRFKPEDEETLHEMRIALKRLRYAVEAAQPVLGPSARQRARKMQELQRLMGDTRDVELLRAKLEKWAAKKGKILAVVPALDQLKEKRERLVKEIVKSSANLEGILPGEKVKTAVETTAIAAETQKARAGAAAAR